MGWTEVRRNDRLEGSDEPFIAIRSDGKVGLNATFVRIKQAWYAAVLRLSPKQRRFEPRQVSTQEGKLWVIQLCPSFEARRARESDRIPSDISGIYRYVRGEEVVYIGRGNIAKRLSEAVRESWEFDRIEYSVIDDPDQQVQWEAHWIDQYKDEHDGKRPLYNLIDGSSKLPRLERNLARSV